jgi:hypothetical protein
VATFADDEPQRLRDSEIPLYKSASASLRL